MTYQGAPADSIYTGSQQILIRTDGGTFANGDPFKCLTCGIPAANAQGLANNREHPEVLFDGRRFVAGLNLFDCGDATLISEACTPAQLRGYPIRLQANAQDTGAGAPMRETRVHPDGVHFGFNLTYTAGGRFGQYAYMGRMVFNPNPTTGTPLVPRFDLTNVVRLNPPPALNLRTLYPNPSNPTELIFNPDAKEPGEFRNFSRDGKEVFYIGYPLESCNIDVFAADLRTGVQRRLTSNPEYVDPVTDSYDGNWTLALDTRASGRNQFISGMRGIPPVTDIITSSACSSVRNNGGRRFFQPILIDRFGDRGAYQGQQINAGDGAPGSFSDPNWNALADANFSPDGTAIAYYQSIVTSPACGGNNPLPCPTSNEPGGRTYRVFLAKLTSRRPTTPLPIQPAPDNVPWGVPYVPGEPVPDRPQIPAGTYTLRGKTSGSATVVVSQNAAGDQIDRIRVTYNNYSDDPNYIINGTEDVAGARPTPTRTVITWFSDLTGTGAVSQSKVTSPEGFVLSVDVFTNIFQAMGTMTTTVNGVVYRQPANGT